MLDPGGSGGGGGCQARPKQTRETNQTGSCSCESFRDFDIHSTTMKGQRSALRGRPARRRHGVTPSRTHCHRRRSSWI